MILKIDINSLFEIVKKTYSADHILLLKAIEEGIDLTSMCESSDRFSTLHTSLIRKGLISETDNKITLIGQELLRFAESEGEEKMEKIKSDGDGFDRWWNAYPKNMEFEYNGKFFSGDRAFKVKKDECRIKFNKIILEGEFTADDLIRALLYEVEAKKKRSVETGQNKMQYMQNSCTYLNQRTYQGFIEDSKKKREESKIYTGTEI